MGGMKPRPRGCKRSGFGYSCGLSASGTGPSPFVLTPVTLRNAKRKGSGGAQFSDEKVRLREAEIIARDCNLAFLHFSLDFPLGAFLGGRNDPSETSLLMAASDPTAGRAPSRWGQERWLIPMAEARELFLETPESKFPLLCRPCGPVTAAPLGHCSKGAA